MDLLSELISSFDPSNPHFRPTELYNENWLIKLVFHQASTIVDETFPLGFLHGSTWFSEGLLPTAFKARSQGDPLSEARTHADGVIGHIRIGAKGKADIELEPNAAQFTVVEAKVGSPLSKGTSNARYFDQAARNVACMAEVIARAEKEPTDFDRLEFIVLAPQYSIEKGTFSKHLEPGSIKSKVSRRVGEYDGELDDWYSTWFEPAMSHIGLHSVSWESAIEWIGSYRADVAGMLNSYYKACLEFN